MSAHQRNLFTFADQYPKVPGAKRTDTSRAAARAMKPRTPTIRDRVLNELRAFGGMTPDECADRLGRSILSVRPRFSELVADGLIEETQERRRNASGLWAGVYVVKGQGAPVAPPEAV